MFTGASFSRQAGKREKVLLRLFCRAYGTKVVLLLNGYDKPSRNGPAAENSSGSTSKRTRRPRIGLL